MHHQLLHIISRHTRFLNSVNRQTCYQYIVADKYNVPTKWNQYFVYLHTKQTRTYLHLADNTDASALQEKRDN